MAANRAQVLIVGVPGPMRDCLLILLKALPSLDFLESDDGYSPPMALSLEKTPDVVLMDFGCPATELTRDVVWIKTNWSSARCLVLADTARQLQVALAAGADAALLRGFAAGEFFSTLRDLLKDKTCLGFEPALPSSGTNGISPENSASIGGEQALLVSPLVF